MDAFIEFLMEHLEDNIYMVKPGGNHGDTMIHMGTIKAMEEVGSNYVAINLEDLYRERPSIGAKYLVNIASWKLGFDPPFGLLSIPDDTDIILFEGGGYMGDLWYGPVLLREAVKRYTTPICVAPQSYMFNRTHLPSLLYPDRPISLFCRENYSYAHLLEMDLPGNVTVDVSKDLALYLDDEDLEGYLIYEDEKYDLFCFRRDQEAAVPKSFINRITSESSNPRIGDISKTGSFRDYVSAVANAERVMTDRLHVAILATIFGKETTLFGNSYHKSIGVWEYSLRDSVRYVDPSELGFK